MDFSELISHRGGRPCCDPHPSESLMYMKCTVCLRTALITGNM